MGLLGAFRYLRDSPGEAEAELFEMSRVESHTVRAALAKTHPTQHQKIERHSDRSRSEIDTFNNKA